MQLQINLLSRYFIWTYLLFLPLWLSAGAIRTFHYDKNNQLIKEQKVNGHAITYEYDPCGRVIKEISSDGATVQFVYDKNGNCTRMTDGHGTTSYSYDPFNQLIAVHFPNSSPIFYKYDVRGRLTEIMYPNGWKISYVYDTSDRLVSVADDSGITKYDYDDAKNTLIKVTLSNGIFTEYQYDRTKRITDVTHKRSDGEVITSFHYCFDANGNRTQIKETGSFGTRNTVCTYDKLNRLIAVVYPESYEKYTYDGIGNRLSKETPDGAIQYEYDQSNHLTKAGETRFFYDLSGNLIKKVSPKETAEFTYDAHDNLIEFRNDKHTVKYCYDGARRRISKSVDGVITQYMNDVHSPVTQVALKKTASNEICALYTYGLSRLSEVIPAGVGFYLYDYPDRNVVALVNRDQRIVNKYEYDSFGCCHGKLMDFPNDFSYAGEAYEEESQLVYLRNRYYDPELGRFISADPEFGSKTNPQSLNPYTYVNNNPLNYIDPEGLRSAKACAYPPGTKTKNGPSSVGHGFWELTFDDGTVKKVGRYPGGPRDNDEICPGTASYEWPATDAQIEQIIASVEKGPYLGVSGNCIDGLERGLDVLGVKHPSFNHYRICTPSKAVIWLESLNGRTDLADALERHPKWVHDPEGYMSTEEENKPQLPAAARSAGDVGGVSLNKTAQLLGHISDVQGATYDDPTGQLIMIGKKKNIALPEMDFDDLAVAVRSIYGLGGKAQDPGVSLDIVPNAPVIFNKREKPPPMIARYEGQTKKTRFGWIMFEADRVLKCLSLGKDNISGKKIHINIPGYKSLPDRYRNRKMSEAPTQMRLWFVPKEMSIYKNRKGNSIAFKKAKMQVLTETTYRQKKKTKKQKNSAAEKFAAHFTRHYNKFAKHYPILKELKRLGKITAVVKWMKENKIPLDLSLFKKYKPAHHHTPKKTPAMQIVRQNENNTFSTTIVGGVIYHLDESNFHEIVNEDMNPLSAAALNARPSENVFEWTFKSPLDSMEYQAVAQTVEQTVKVGNIKKACLDMRFPVSGDYPLELVRYYNSFNDNDIGLGRGWDFVCTRLRFPRSKMNVKWKNESTPVAVYPEIFAEVDGRELRYNLVGLGQNHNPLYQSNEEQTILVETNHGYTLIKPSGKQLTFNFEGKILSKGRDNHVQITYRYNGDNRLVEISHANGKKIQLTYDHDRILQVCGPGEKCIQYGYNAYGQLDHIADNLGIIEKYAYDSDTNLNTIRNCRNEPIFNAVYDDYHRATSEMVLGERQTKSFDLKAHALNVDKSGKSKFCCKYDSSYRLLQASDSEDRLVKMIYEEGQIRPKTISDCMGNEKNYTYDHRGNIVRILDSGGTEQRFWYNQNDQLFAYLDGRGRAELYSYNEQGRLSKICHFAQLISDDPENGKVNFNYSQSHVTEYDYEPNSGRLQWIKRGPDLVQSFAYNQEGLLIATTSPAGHTLHRSYDQRGRLSRLWDPQEEGFEYCYDNRDRLIRLSSHDGMIEYRYDDIGNLSSIQDACGAITYYSFDSFGNLLKIEDPAGGQTRYEYDESHNLKRIILPNGSIREIDYDAVNRPKVDSW